MPWFADPAYPTVSDGKIWAKPLQNWMVKPATIDASGSLSLEIVAESTGENAVFLLADTWPREGYIYQGGGQYNGLLVDANREGYAVMIHGGSWQEVLLTKHEYIGGTRVTDHIVTWNPTWDPSNHNMAEPRTYRVERDVFGSWSLFYGDADGQNMQDALISLSDLTFSSFSHVGVRMHNEPSAFDSIRVSAESSGPIPEPFSATLALLGLAGLGIALGRRGVASA